jgi:hypothetical protein
MVALPAVLVFTKFKKELFAIVALPAELAPEKFTLPPVLVMTALPAVLLLTNPKFEAASTINAGALEELLMMPAPVNVSPKKGGSAKV